MVRRAFLLIALSAVTASGASLPQRTFVASFGSDANACTRLAPCRNFDAAIAQTDTGGEVVVLDSAGYGSMTITRSVDIIAPAGVLRIENCDMSGTLGDSDSAGLLMTSSGTLFVDNTSIHDAGEFGVYLNAPTGNVVGILSRVRVENNIVDNGIFISAPGRLTIRDSSISNNGFLEFPSGRRPSSIWIIV